MRLHTARNRPWIASPALTVLAPLLALQACLDGAGPRGRSSVARVEIVAEDSAILLGHTLQLETHVWDSTGTRVEPGRLVWRSTDSTVLTVDARGLIRAVSRGDALVLAVAVPEGAADTIAVHVAVQGDVKWHLALGPMPVSGGAAEGPDGTIYVLVHDDAAAFGSSLYAVDPSGRVKWHRPLTQVLDNFPVVGTDGAVYVVGQHVWALNPDGSLRWALTNRPPSLPSFYAGAASASGILVAAMGYDLFAFDAANGDTLWEGPRTPDASWIIPSTFSADGRTVFIKRSTDSGSARAAASGVLRWQVPDPLPGRLSFPGAAVDGGTVYFAGAYQLFGTDTLGTVFGLSPDRGCCVSEPAIDPDGTLYVQIGGSANGLWAFRPVNSERWRMPGIQPSRGWYGGPALAAGGVLYAAARDGFYALQLSPTGATVRWRFPADTSQRLRFFGAPLIGRDGTVYSFTSTVVGQDPTDASDELFAFWEDRPVETDSPWPMWRHDARRSGQAHR